VRRILAAFAVAVTAALCLAGTASADQSLDPPFIARAEWAKWGDLSSLRVYPTESGRAAAAQLGTTAQAGEAWTEVLALSPDAASSGMREQFMCHWQYAEFAQPGKTSWNLEPWRPQVTADQMVAAGCNPGGTEEPF
jgi:hypothetical protein